MTTDVQQIVLLILGQQNSSVNSCCHPVTVFVKWNLTFYTNITIRVRPKKKKSIIFFFTCWFGPVLISPGRSDLDQSRPQLDEPCRHAECTPVWATTKKPTYKHLFTYHEARNGHRLAFFKRNQQLHSHIIFCHTFRARIHAEPYGRMTTWSCWWSAWTPPSSLTEVRWCWWECCACSDSRSSPSPGDRRAWRAAAEWRPAGRRP